MSSTLAIDGCDSVARGKAALASEAGAGTSICGVGAKGGVAGAFGSISHRTQTRKNIRTAREPMRRTGLKPGCEKAREETPGTCGTSVLKRSDGGWPGILQYSLDNVRAASTRSLAETRQSRQRTLL